MDTLFTVVRGTAVAALPLLAPLPAAAAPRTFKEFAGLLAELINSALVPLLFGAALVVFIWGVLRYFIADSSQAKEKGKHVMLWGIFALFVMVSVWGIVLLVTRTFFGIG